MASNYTANPTATQAPGPQPAPNVLPIISIPAGSDVRTIESITQALKENTDWSGYLNQQPKFLFCYASDGNVTLDGVVAAPSWATKVGTVYTMTRDTTLGNLTVTGAGVVLKTANFRLIGNGTCTTAAGAIIQNDGPAGSGGTGGTVVAAGSLGTGTNGGTNSVNNAPGVAGANITNAEGSRGGSGGTSSIQAGGAAGTLSAPATSAGQAFIVSPQTAGWLFSNSGSWLQFTGGSGGGGGGDSSTTGIGGGGGAGAGVMVVMFRAFNLANASDIHCNGGAGGNAVAGGSTGSGGGGGGGGGALLIAFGYSNQTFTAAVNCAGGAGGIATGAGSPGVAGSTGNLILWSLA